jgi:hypothetical protein
MLTITLAELRNLFLAQKKQTLMSMVCVTYPSMRASDANGTPNPYRKGKGKAAIVTVSKILKVNGTVGGNFRQMVQNKAKAEIIGERIACGLPPLEADALATEAESRYVAGESWHTPIIDDDGEPTCLCVHKDSEDHDTAAAYVRFVFRAKGEAEYVCNETATKVSSEALAPFLTPPSQYSNQHVERKTIIVTYALASVVEVAMGGQRYRISDTLAALGDDVASATLSVADEFLAASRTMETV